MHSRKPSFVAGNVATINPATFVRVDPLTSNAVIQCISGLLPHGVSQEYPKLAPFGSQAATASDTAGDPVQVYTVGEVCLLQASSGTAWNPGDKLKPDGDNSGRGVATTTSNDYYGAIALEACATSAFGKVLVMVGKV